MNRPLTKHLEEVQGTKEAWDWAEKLMTDKELNKFPLTEEEAFHGNESDEDVKDRAYRNLKNEFTKHKEAYQQIAENLSYYIGLADRYYQEAEVVRAERDELQKNYEMALFERDEWKEKYMTLLLTDKMGS